MVVAVPEGLPLAVTLTYGLFILYKVIRIFSYITLLTLYLVSALHIQ